MQNFIRLFLAMVFLTTAINAQEQRNVLIEVFTNSHCSVCPPAHAALNSYNQNSSNAENVNYIFYHMRYPYNDDPLFQANTADTDGRDLFYGPFGSTPKAFFDGAIQQNNYSSWGAALDLRAAVQSPLKINLTGAMEEDKIEVKAEVLRSGNISNDDLVIHFVIVENISFQGRNGITEHKNVMRKMITSPAGEVFSINLNETKNIEKNIDILNEWNTDRLSVIVFIQSSGSKEVIQSETILYSELGNTTSIDGEEILPQKFSLEQNYPNPFNPTTKIKFTIPTSPSLPLLSKEREGMKFVTLKVYDILGNEVATLVNEEKPAGEYEVEFNMREILDLSSGIYIYILSTNQGKLSRKMLLLK